MSENAEYDGLCPDCTAAGRECPDCAEAATQSQLDANTANDLQHGDNELGLIE